MRYDKDSVTPDIRLSDLGTAMSLLTQVPLHTRWVDPDRLAQSVWAFPLAGVLVGAFGGLVLKILTWIGLTQGLAAAGALGAIVMITGGLHEDGLADSADGLGGGSTKERALEIMKDSQIGAYGTIALVLFLIARWSAISDLSQMSVVLGLIWVGAVSRLPMVFVMAGMAHARDGGLSRHVGRPEPTHVGLALLLTTLITLYILGLWGLLMLLVVLCASLPLVVLGYRKIGGQTGDILGGVQQCAEVAALICLTVLWV